MRWVLPAISTYERDEINQTVDVAVRFFHKKKNKQTDRKPCNPIFYEYAIRQSERGDLSPKRQSSKQWEWIQARVVPTRESLSKRQIFCLSGQRGFYVSYESTIINN